jgi:uncharacterized RDD family membrane protein YckC
MRGAWIDTLQIKTPEGIAFSLVLAGPASRFLAWAIDLGVQLVFMLALQGIGAMLGLASFNLTMTFYILGYFVFTIGYAILLEWFWRGQTLGKRIVGIRVMDVQGLKLQFSQVVLRNLFRFLDGIPLFYLIGGAAMLVNRRHQRLGDLAANTIVIRHRTAKAPNLQQLEADKYNSFDAYPHLQARLRQRISPTEAALVVEAILRREELEPQARATLFRELAAHFRALVTFPDEAVLGLTDEQYLRNVAASIFREKAEKREKRKGAA